MIQRKVNDCPSGLRSALLAVPRQNDKLLMLARQVCGERFEAPVIGQLIGRRIPHQLPFQRLSYYSTKYHIVKAPQNLL